MMGFFTNATTTTTKLSFPVLGVFGIWFCQIPKRLQDAKVPLDFALITAQCALISVIAANVSRYFYVALCTDDKEYENATASFIVADVFKKALENLVKHLEPEAGTPKGGAQIAPSN